MKIRKTARRIRAAEDVDVDVAPEATELLFETNDVADLVAEATGEDVSVETNEDSVEFTIGDDQVITVEPEGDEEILESSTRLNRRKKAVKASTRTRASKTYRSRARRR